MAKNINEKGFNDVLADLRKGEVCSLYIFEGEEDYLKEKLVIAIEKTIIDPSSRDIDYVFINMPEKQNKISLEGIKNETDSPPFLSKRRMVVVKNSSLFSSSGKGSSKSEDTEKFIKIISGLPDSVCLVFLEEKVDKRQKSLIKAVKENGVLANIKKPDLRTTRTWIVKELAKHNIKIEASACDEFIQRNDSGLRQMTGEIEKLVLYAKASQAGIINMKHVSDVGVTDIKGTIFNLTDALSDGDAHSAYKIFDSLIIQKQPLPLISYMIARHFKQLIIAKDFSSSADIAQHLKIIPFVANKLYYQSRKFSEEQLLNIYNECYETEMNVKTSKIPDQTGIETLFTFILNSKNFQKH